MSTSIESIVSKLRERTAVDFTEREWQTLRLMAQGLVSKQIAHEIGCGERSIEVYRSRVMTSLGAKTPAHAVYIACCRGLL